MINRCNSSLFLGYLGLQLLRSGNRSWEESDGGYWIRIWPHHRQADSGRGGFCFPANQRAVESLGEVSFLHLWADSAPAGSRVRPASEGKTHWPSWEDGRCVGGRAPRRADPPPLRRLRDGVSPPSPPGRRGLTQVPHRAPQGPNPISKGAMPLALHEPQACVPHACGYFFLQDAEPCGTNAEGRSYRLTFLLLLTVSCELLSVSFCFPYQPTSWRMANW